MATTAPSGPTSPGPQVARELKAPDASPDVVSSPPAPTVATHIDAGSMADAASGPATPAQEPPDPWIGLTYAEVRKATARGAAERSFGPPDTDYPGVPTVTVHGPEWTIEWEPGGCSDWTMALFLHFTNGRVARVTTKHRYHSTGKECR
jgi:hypothetical protein